MTIFHLNLIGYEYYTYPPKFKDDGSTIMYKWRKLYLNINLQKQNRGHFIRRKNWGLLYEKIRANKYEG